MVLRRVVPSALLNDNSFSNLSSIFNTSETNVVENKPKQITTVFDSVHSCPYCGEKVRYSNREYSVELWVCPADGTKIYVTNKETRKK